MPIYEYECQSCGYRSETMQRVNDPPLRTCPECGGEYRKLISPPALQFKGSGWYVTDYARKGGGKDDKEKAKEPEKKTDAKGGEKKGSGDSGTKAKNGS